MYRLKGAITRHLDWRNEPASAGGARSPGGILSSQWQIQFYAIVNHLGRKASALTSFQTDEAIGFHGLQRARQVRLPATGKLGQFVERAGRLVGNDPEQLAVPGREHLRERLRRGEPHLGFAAHRRLRAACDPHRAFFHLIVAGDADLQRGHQMTPFSRRTASTVAQKSASKLAASLYS